MFPEAGTYTTVKVFDSKLIEQKRRKQRVTLKSQFQFQFETSVSVFIHSAAINPLCISCLITWSELGKLLKHMDFCLFFSRATSPEQSDLSSHYGVCMYVCMYACMDVVLWKYFSQRDFFLTPDLA